MDGMTMLLDFIVPFIGYNSIDDIIPHLVAWFLYIIAILLSVYNIYHINTRKRNNPIKTALNVMSCLIVLICTLFVFIQMYWIRYSIIAVDPTTMAMLWTTFHYFNAVNYIIMSSGIYVYSRWRIQRCMCERNSQYNDWL